ncbi:DNA binding [Phytophthora oleae]|uniref:DNA binding n=1 Tax=Phytophthora oleae TaxID=2107226 RepID=A0ABD3FCU2_9STRA
MQLKLLKPFVRLFSRRSSRRSVYKCSMLTKPTITTRGAKTVWVKCSNKDKSRATVMLLADWEGKKYPPFMMFKSTPATTKEKREANNSERNGFGTMVWREIFALQKETNRQIYGNKCAWWNSTLSLQFLAYHFAGRENFDDNILLLWDDFSGYWTAEVVEYAASLNVIILKVPPKYTYVCQPADVSWNKPFKSGLRSKWISRLRDQLAAYHAGEKRRATKRDKLEKDITRARKDLVQAEADQEVARLRKDHVEEPFKLEAPNRKDIARWVASCWGDLTPATITSGFRRVSAD